MHNVSFVRKTLFHMAGIYRHRKRLTNADITFVLEELVFAQGMMPYKAKKAT